MEKRTSQYTDTELFYQLQNAATAEAAFTELYTRHSSRVYAYCRRILGDAEEAQDIFQDAFTKFFQSAKQEREMTNVPAFLLRIARNLCLNSKRAARQPAVQIEDFHLPAHDTPYDKTELLQLITMALDLLPHDYRESFVLREYDGMSYAETAEIVGASIATVKIRVFRAKQKIREVLAPYLADVSGM